MASHASPCGGLTSGGAPLCRRRSARIGPPSHALERGGRLLGGRWSDDASGQVLALRELGAAHRLSRHFEVLPGSAEVDPGAEQATTRLACVDANASAITSSGVADVMIGSSSLSRPCRQQHTMPSALTPISTARWKLLKRP